MRRRSSCSVSPMTAPTRQTLSTASSSGFHPTPSSRMGVIGLSHRDVAGVRRIHAADDLQQRALAAAVAAHDAERLALSHLEANPLEHLKPLEAPRLEQPEHVLADGVAADGRNPERLRDGANIDDRHHRYSAARGASRRNIAQPAASAIATTPARHRCAVAVGHRAAHEHVARELDDRGRGPEIEIEMEAFGKNAERIDDGRHEKPRLDHHVPDLIQIAVAQEQHARPQ